MFLFHITAGRDFLPDVDILTFVPGVGSQRQCACVQILQDVEDDNDEQFLVTINTTSPDITIIRDTSAVTIVDDDRKKICYYQANLYIL